MIDDGVLPPVIRYLVNPHTLSMTTSGDVDLNVKPCEQDQDPKNKIHLRSEGTPWFGPHTFGW